MKRALVTGITGQDGRFLAQFLTGKGYQVSGLIRGQNNPKAQMVLDETPSLELVDGDLRDLSSLIAAVEQVQPDEVYNLGAISYVPLSWKQPELTSEITGLGVLRMVLRGVLEHEHAVARERAEPRAGLQLDVDGVVDVRIHAEEARVVAVDAHVALTELDELRAGKLLPQRLRDLGREPAVEEPLPLDQPLGLDRAVDDVGERLLRRRTDDGDQRDQCEADHERRRGGRRPARVAHRVLAREHA